MAAAKYLANHRSPFDKSFFFGVFNASGCEHRGISYHSAYARQGIQYESLVDANTGMTLGNCDKNITRDLERIAKLMAKMVDIEPSIIGLEAFPIHKVQTCTKTAFLHLMFEANHKLKRLNKLCYGKPILVHCKEGHNRSASVVASYAYLTKNVPIRTIVRLIADRAWDEIGDNRVFSNMRFKSFLLCELEKTNEGDARRAYEKEHCDIIALAKKVTT